MAGASKKTGKADLDRIAEQLAKVRILPVAEGDHIFIRAWASFTTRSFEAGKYRVSIGFKQALLTLDHPSFEREDSYRATLPKDIVAQGWASQQTNNANIGGGLNLGMRVFDFIGFRVDAAGSKKNQDSVKVQANAPYPIVSIAPFGWRIGTERGDPRTMHGNVPPGLEFCLNNEYLRSHGHEKGEGPRDKNKELALCKLTPKSGGSNDPKIVAALFGESGSLTLRLEQLEGGDGLGNLTEQNEKAKQERELREAFVQICVRRAEQVQAEGVSMDTSVSGDLFLAKDQKHAPKLARKDGPDVPQRNVKRPVR